MLSALLRPGAEIGAPCARLPALRIRHGDYDPETEAVFEVSPPLVTVSVDAGAPRHVHERLADLAPLLNFSAPRLTHAGALPARLRDAGAPGRLSFCDRETAFLIPDSFFWRSGAYRSHRRAYAFAPSWSRRSPSVLWRGSTTGPLDRAWTDSQRARLCRIARDAPAGLEFDVGFTAVVQQAEEAEAAVRAEGLMRPWTPASAYAGYRHHIDIDGNTNSWNGLFTKLLSGGLVFKVGSPAGWRQWYYPRLHAWLHYVPVDRSLDDLEEKVRWAHTHPAQAERIARAGRRFAEGMTLRSEAGFAVAVMETALASGPPPAVEPRP